MPWNEAIRNTKKKCLWEEIQMIKTYKISYMAVRNRRTIKMQGFSKDDVKRRFVAEYPDKKILEIVEVVKK